MNRKTTKKVDESTLTTLCAVCRGAFLDAKGVRLRRADPRQLVKDVCTYCQTRYGFDYYVQPIVRKSKMTGKENRRETEPAYGFAGQSGPECSERKPQRIADNQ